MKFGVDAEPLREPSGTAASATMPEEGVRKNARQSALVAG